jgi:hypothetical protein
MQTAAVETALGYMTPAAFAAKLTETLFAAG